MPKNEIDGGGLQSSNNLGFEIDSGDFLGWRFSGFDFRFFGVSFLGLILCAMNNEGGDILKIIVLNNDFMGFDFVKVVVGSR